MEILVTGGAGYLGSVLVPRLLEAGHKVTVLDSLFYSQRSLLGVAGHPNFRFERGDARDEQTLRTLLRSADFIVPLAALVGAPACEALPDLASSLNLGAIERLIRLRDPSQGVVFPTTNSGYGTTSGEVYCTEETPLNPISIYGRTKVAAEEALLEAGNAVTLRLATVFGVSPRMRLDLLVNTFVYEAVTRGYLMVYEKAYKRNYVHIADVADCILFCLEHHDRMGDEAYNVGLDEANHSKESLALLVKEQVPKCAVFFSETGKDPDQRNYIVSNAKLFEQGFTATRSVQQGITELLRAYRMLAIDTEFRNA